MYHLYSVPRSTGGMATDHGDWPTLKMATMVARAIQMADPGTPRYFSASDPDERIHHPEAGLTGVTHTITLEPPKYRAGQAVEVVFSDGTVHWTDDLEESFALANAILEQRELAHTFKHDLVYAITTNGCGMVYLENEVGVAAEHATGDDDRLEEFQEAVSEMLFNAEHNRVV